ncbi:MAG: uroporphyrinogen decarboxylase [Thermaerobacter sp.]|nr:uroporphyrinogen decarboxylase [Thermaerobacter sp.]
MSPDFLAACRRQPAGGTPVWFMRQAGRYQPEYRKIRERRSLLEICALPDICTEVTLLPVHQLGVDAAILFSDITVPLLAVGVHLRIEENVGPVIERPFTSAQDIERLRPLVPEEDEPYVSAAVGQIVSELNGLPLIGFGGGPFTLASYLVEGGPSRQYLKVKGLMWEDPATFRRLLERLAEITFAHLEAQVRAGAAALQIFDSWIGSLTPYDYRTHVLPVMQGLFARLRSLSVPTIYFGVETAGLLPLMAEAGADALGVDWRVDLAEAWRVVGTRHAIQGNLDPALLLGPWPEVERGTRRVLAAANARPGHIFNLGHGVLPTTPPDILRRVVDLVHASPAEM